MTVAAECGYCGQVVAIPEGASESFVACPTCGWMIDTSATIPTVPPVPVVEPAETPLAFPPAYAPVLSDSGEPDGAPNDRVSGLELSWWNVHDGLSLARGSNGLASLFMAGLVILDVYVVLSAGRGPVPVGLPAAIVVVPGLIFAVIGHTWGQFLCASAPASHGGLLAAGAAALCALAAVLIGCLAPSGEWVGIAIVSGILLLLSWATWLMFLYQLGVGLRDRDLSSMAGSYMLWYLVGFVVTILLTAAAWRELAAGNQTESLLWRLPANIISLSLAGGYQLLLGLAANVVARRAPLTPRARQRFEQRGR